MFAGTPLVKNFVADSARDYIMCRAGREVFSGGLRRDFLIARAAKFSGARGSSRACC
jgi:hypothetical protein